MGIENKNIALTLENAAQPSDSSSRFPQARSVLWLLGLYFVLQFVLRTFLSPSLELDESEQVVLSQQFSLGYGSSPPLYTWIQMVFFATLGEGVLALSLLKNLLLFSTYALTYVAGRRVTGSVLGGTAAAISLLLIPQIVWESQRDLTHSVLAGMLSVATLVCLWDVIERKRTRDYILFGICGGLGLLSKYNYAFWWLGLLLAGVSLLPSRPALLSWRMGLAILISVVMFMPNGLWILEHRSLALADASKFDMNTAIPIWRTLTNEVIHALGAVSGYVAPLAGLYLLVLFRAPRNPGAMKPTLIVQLITRALLIVGALVLVLVCMTHATGLRGRWFQPILVCLPVLAAALAFPRLSEARVRRLTWVGIAAMLIVPGALASRVLLSKNLHREETLARPYVSIAAQIKADLPPDTMVVTDTKLLAGNLRLGLTDARVVTPELVPLLGVKTAHCFIAWDAKRKETPPSGLLKWVQAGSSKDAKNDVKTYRAPYLHDSSQNYSVALMQLF